MESVEFISDDKWKINSDIRHDFKFDSPLLENDFWWFIGMWLGDGHSIDAKTTQANEVVWSEIKKRGYKVGNDISQGGAGKATTRTVFGLQTKLRMLGLLLNKHGAG